MADLYRQIATLETLHKRSQLVTTYGELLQARRQLKDLLTKRYLRSIQRSKGFFYTHANKGGRYLARLLKDNTPHAQVQITIILGRHLNTPNPRNSDRTITSYIIYDPRTTIMTEKPTTPGSRCTCEMQGYGNYKRKQRPPSTN
ncbi:Hypothetical predicted protein [Pelobates cultripes]|uniref:Uncharacterized protein n=1 Tax=Pelobates cultripes TaxID=61616 RepID=A0AAD1R9R5_PELCU|nr:Hypothetical predicted protein [Pelobates cultripes]